LTVLLFLETVKSQTTIICHGDNRVLKSRNISDNGAEVVDIDGYDSYISTAVASGLSVFDYLDRDDVYITPI
jgi:DNA (cytosine-5)-methyltransferase 1